MMSVQPAIPIWVTVALAFLAPVAALVGVVVGAVMQRRTTRLQLEATEKRDRELWAREDRHRFTEKKRELYAEYLDAYFQYCRWITAAYNGMSIGTAMGGASDSEASEFRKKLFVEKFYEPLSPCTPWDLVAAAASCGSTPRGSGGDRQAYLPDRADVPRGVRPQLHTWFVWPTMVGPCGRSLL